jgi:hypothetical protein
MHIIATILLLLCTRHEVDAFITGSSSPQRCNHNFRDPSKLESSSKFRRSKKCNGNRFIDCNELLQIDRCQWPLNSLQGSSSEKEAEADQSEEEIQQSLDYLASLIQTHLNLRASGSNATTQDSSDTSAAVTLAKNRFVDLTTSLSSETVLENLFSLRPPPNNNDTRQIQIAIASLQSLLIFGMQIGVKGSEESQSKMVRHLFRRTDPPPPKSDRVPPWIDGWTSEDVRRLKFHRSTELAKRALAALKRRRTAVGAYELLVEMGAWRRHEEVGLLRSGFPVRFLEDELKCSNEVRGLIVTLLI